MFAESRGKRLCNWKGGGGLPWGFAKNLKIKILEVWVSVRSKPPQKDQVREPPKFKDRGIQEIKKKKRKSFGFFGR